MRRQCWKPIELLVLFLLVATTGQDAPNIVILFADNLGYNDVGIFGSPTAKTPNIDRLGYEGLKLNNWNSAAHLCSASRATLLTGKYAVRTGVYPAVFCPGAQYGLMPKETTLAEYLKKDAGYATSIVGKWHLGHLHEYLPTTSHGFDEWLGIPYHMSGGSLDQHECGYDVHRTLWLPLYENDEIIQQPVQVHDLAKRYADKATGFISKQVLQEKKPFFLYMAFSHVHQLCAPKFGSEQNTCQWASVKNATIVDAVQEMDWMAGEILNALDETGVTNDTLVLFTSDNGPWVAEQMCSGSKGPFEGRWLQQHVAMNCTACPHDFVPDPTRSRPRRCVLNTTTTNDNPIHAVDGVHCGADTGLGSVWEANVRLPALVRWPNHVPAATESMEMVSTLDVVPTVLSLVKQKIPAGLDGQDISNVLLGRKTETTNTTTRTLFFWRDGFQDGPLPPPYGRFDVVAVKHGRIKAWFYTKSAHYNADVEVHHDPPLLFDILADPAEAHPLDPAHHEALIALIYKAVEQHKASVDWTFPLALAQDPKNIPCVDRETSCRTSQDRDTVDLAEE